MWCDSGDDSRHSDKRADQSGNGQKRKKKSGFQKQKEKQFISGGYAGDSS